MSTQTSTSSTTGVPVPASPAATVTAIYEAFGRGDVPTILSFLAEDVLWDGDWADSFAQRSPVEHFLSRRGASQVGEFFALLAGYCMHDFRVLDLMASSHQVSAEVLIDVTTASGGRYRDEEMHLWSFGEDGRVVRLRHYIDTAKHLAAARGEDTTRTS